MGKDFGGLNSKRHLHLGQDHAEMGDGNDVFAGVHAVQMLCSSVNAVGCLVPAFAAGGRVGAGGFPVGAGQVGVFFGDFGKVDAVPCAKMQFAQMWVVGQAGACACDGICGCDATGQIGGNDHSVIGQMRGKSRDLFNGG